MEMDKRIKYEKFCQINYVPVFSQPWWMDAAVGKENWQVFLVENSGTIFAALPYYRTTRDGYDIITKAPNTQNNGIIFSYPKGQSSVRKTAFEEKCINEICDYIENLGIDKYEQQYHYSFTNWLPFFWRYYKEITRYTYVIDTTQNQEIIEQNYSPKIRNYLKKAQQFVHCEDLMDVELFYGINRMSFDRQGKEIPYSLDFVKNIYNAGVSNNACKMLQALDDAGNVHSVAFLIWDEKSVYYLLNGTNPKFKASQANDLLIHESIKFAKSIGRNFDFEGSVIKPIEKAFREFGGEKKAYFRIYKTFNKELLRQELEMQLKE